MKILLIIAAIFAAAFAARKKIDATGGSVRYISGGGGIRDIAHPKRPEQCLGGGGFDEIVLNPSISSGFKLSFNIGTVHNSIPRTCARQED